MREVVAPGQYLGAVALVARNGRIVASGAYGYRDLARLDPMDLRTIFRIYSITKTVATVAVLMLQEEGKVSMSDAVGKHLPEFAASRATIHHLLTHTTGFAEATESMEASVDLAAYSRLAARQPALAPPGQRFRYNSVNAEVASRLVEVVSGKSFEAFLHERIFVPLAMYDTGFTVPAEKRARIADMTSTDPEGRLVPWEAIDAKFPGDRLRRWTSGAGGLYSTVGDLARFCQALLDGGALDGVRILSRQSVERMTRNQLGHLERAVSQYGEGFGYGGFVNLDDPRRERPGSVGAFGWSGAASTYYMIDPRERMTMILLMQHDPRGLPRDPRKPSFGFYRLVYQSLARQ